MTISKLAFHAFSLRTLLTASLTFCSLGLSQGEEPLLHEDFEKYSVGMLNGQEAQVPGLDGDWVVLGEAEIVEAGINGKSVASKATGKWTYVALDLQPGDSELDKLNGVNGLLGESPGAEAYISFRLKLQTADADKSQVLIAFPGEINSKGALSIGQVWGKSTFSALHGKPSEITLDDKEHLFLVKLARTGGGKYQAEIFIDPVNPTRLPLGAQKPSMVVWPKDENIRFIAFRSNGNDFLLDDLKIGATAESVINGEEAK